MSDELKPCPIHGDMVLVISLAEAERRGVEHGCPSHNAEIRSRLDVATMTRQERAAELRSLVGPLYSGWDVLRERLDALVGRPLMTHELAGIEYLEHEILTGNVPTIEGVLAKLPHDKPVIVVRTDA